jgi:hypothetical protein
MSMRPPLDEHPLLRVLAAVDDALDEAAELDPTFLPTRDKERALVAVQRVLSRLEGLKHELVAAAGDVADDHAARSAGQWLAVETRSGARTGARDQRTADGLGRWPVVGIALRAGAVNLAQAEVITRAMDALPGELDPELVAKACGQLLADAGHFGPRELQVLGRRVLQVIAPDLADAHEARALSAEEARARAATRLSFRPRGDGTTDLSARLPEAVASRLRVYLDAYTSPRRLALDSDVDQLPLPRRRGEAFCALLEHVPADRLPSHGGTATTVMVTLDLDTLRSGLGLAETSTGGVVTAAEARRLACTAGIVPVVLGGTSEVLDLGRTRRLFSPAQRKALALRDRHCRAQGCDIPAAWCEAHHAREPWSQGGRTDLADGLLLCPFHHHRAHDPTYDQRHLPTGALRYTRRT